MYFLGNEIAPFFKVASESRKIDLYTAATEQQSSAAIVGDHSSDPGMATAGARRAREDASVAQRERASHGGDNPFLMTQDDDSQCSIKKSLPQAQLFKKKKIVHTTLLRHLTSSCRVTCRENAPAGVPNSSCTSYLCCASFLGRHRQPPRGETGRRDDARGHGTYGKWARTRNEGRARGPNPTALEESQLHIATRRNMKRHRANFL
jgi:hypothetical protein